MVLRTLETMGQLRGYGIARRIYPALLKLEHEAQQWAQTITIMSRFLSPGEGV